MKVTKENIGSLDFTKLALTFKTSGPVSQMAKLHAIGCNMLNAAGNRKVRLATENVRDHVEDALELGYAVTVCKCAH